MNKIIKSSEIGKCFKSGDQILVGGFGLSGTPLTIIDELLK
ncbi:CoA-transferase, partial [Bacillus sp. JJ634]